LGENRNLKGLTPAKMTNNQIFCQNVFPGAEQEQNIMVTPKKMSLDAFFGERFLQDSILNCEGETNLDCAAPIF